MAVWNRTKFTAIYNSAWRESVRHPSVDKHWRKCILSTQTKIRSHSVHDVYTYLSYYPHMTDTYCRWTTKPHISMLKCFSTFCQKKSFNMHFLFRNKSVPENKKTRKETIKGSFLFLTILSQSTQQDIACRQFSLMKVS